MKLSLRYLALLACFGCGSSDNSASAPVDAGADVDAATPKELVCASNFCGHIVDKVNGAEADCGDCTYGQCGDNGIANVCGAACMPLTAPDGDGGTYHITPACDYLAGPGWGAGYGEELQFPGACNYMNPDNCVYITISSPPNKPCGPTVCGNWYCCVSNPDAGVSPYLPGAVANNDGGLP